MTEEQTPYETSGEPGPVTDEPEMAILLDAPARWAIVRPDWIVRVWRAELPSETLSR